MELISSRSSWIQCAMHFGIGRARFPTSTLSQDARKTEVTTSCGKVAFERVYGTLVNQTEKMQTKVPESCTVSIVRSVMPKYLGWDLLGKHPITNGQLFKLLTSQASAFVALFPEVHFCVLLLHACTRTCKLEQVTDVSCGIRKQGHSVVTSRR